MKNDFRDYVNYLSHTAVDKDDELMHFGILGMKWGVRRFQNPDGTLTEAGKKRYGKAVEKLNNKKRNRLNVYDSDGKKVTLNLLSRNSDNNEKIKSFLNNYSSYDKKIKEEMKMHGWSTNPNVRRIDIDDDGTIGDYFYVNGVGIMGALSHLDNPTKKVVYVDPSVALMLMRQTS